MAGSTKESPTPVGHLANLADCRLAASQLFSDCRRGVVPASDGSKMAHILALVAKLLEQSETEKRLTSIEERLNQMESRAGEP